MRERCWQALLVFAASCVLAGAVAATPAFAGAWWRVSARDAPTYLPEGGQASIVVTASNVGDAGVNATRTPVTIADTLPAGLRALAIRGAPAFELVEEGHQMSCDLASVSCTSQAEVFPPFQALDVTIEVAVQPGAGSGEQNDVTVEGGEQQDMPGSKVESATLAQPILVSDQPTPFGVEPDGYQLTPENEGGTLDTQAGSHPFQLTTTLNLDQTLEPVPGLGAVPAAPALAKQLAFQLPPGLLGDPLAVPACSMVDFFAIGNGDTNQCQPQSAIGVAVVTINEAAQFHYVTRTVPLWNLEPERGEPARLGFEVLKVPVVLDTAVRTGGDYGVTVSIEDAPQAAQILSSEVTIWGTPGAQAHDPARGWACLLEGVYVDQQTPCQEPNPRSSSAFLTLPTACTGPTKATVQGSSWPLQTLAGERGRPLELEGPATEALLPALEGCQRLPFNPSLALEVQTHDASTPTGLSASVELPQQSTLSSEGLAEADVQSVSVTLPAGVQLSPSAANGLEACSEQQIGYEGPAGADPLAPGAPQPLRFSSEPVSCPPASKLGTVHITTPLLEHELAGAVYLAAQNANPFGSLLAMYVVAEDPYSGIRAKLAGELHLDPQTGQITTSFATDPQVPFERFTLEFPNGPRAAVTTPALCDNYATAAGFTPWSGAPADETTSPASEFQITSGAEGSGCQSPPPLDPSLTAGSTSLIAGAFTNFSLQIVRPDSNQTLTALSVTLPPGVAALLSTITPCPEPQASQGTCPADSQIGQATAYAGLGPDPDSQTGRVYLTGPYEGAPFGLAIVTPAVAGPFNLGTVLVRSKIEVNPHTAQVTISSSLPTIVEGVGMAPTGIPLALKQIRVTVDRPDFEFNPTSCNPLRIEATLTGAQGASASPTSPFQVAGCQALPFKPAVTASTEGHTSKADGASLALTFKSHAGEAHVGKTILTIPATLPARLTTIQKACLARVFEANPAACPEGSDIGTAIVHTPVLKNPLTGPIYLVSHGNAAWPDAELVLQGEGITVILDGQTAIKKGVTTSSFLSVPDAPFETVEATLPEGPHSALTTTPNLAERTHYSLCGQSLTIPAALTGQNGTAVNESVKVEVEGCGAVKATKAKKLTRGQKLALALKACRQRVHRVKRKECEQEARAKYGPRGKGSVRKRGSGSS